MVNVIQVNSLYIPISLYKMKFTKILESEPTTIYKKGKLTLTDFLNYAIQIGHNVNNDPQHWIDEYMLYASTR